MLFPELDLVWNIIILIALGLVAAYLALLGVNLLFAGSFKSLMKKDNRGIRVALSTKLDILKKCEEVIIANDIPLPDDCRHSLKYLDTEDFLEAQKPEFETSKDELTRVESTIKSVIHRNEKLSKNKDISLLLALLSDVNDSLKTSIMAYNADVLGFNYWIRFAPCIFIFIIFRAKKRKTI